MGTTERPYVGGVKDFVGVPYSYGNNSVYAHLNTAYYHVHGEAWVYPKYTADVELTSAAGAYATTGNIIEVLPADTLTASDTTLKPFDIHWVSISDIPANGEYIIDIYKGESGSEELISAFKVTRTFFFTQEIPIAIQIPQQEAGERISAKLTDSTASSQTVKIHFHGHFYG